MASQNNSGRQFDKQHGVTVVATADINANRFIAYDGGYPSDQAADFGTAKDVQGVSESSAMVRDAFTVVTGYSYLVETAEPIAFGQYVKSSVDGRAVVGAIDDNCGQALGSATAAGRLIEVKLNQQVRPPVEEGGGG